jgi:polyisoprenoid-binding protein YceI
MNKILSAVAAASVFFAAPAAAATYQIDPQHSSVSFSVRHIVTKVHGGFDKFSGTFSYDAEKPAKSSVDVTIDPATINTKVAARDGHLRSDAFFDVAKCPAMTFKSTKVELKGESGKLIGDLTMRCVTKPVVLALEVAGEGKDPKGNVHFGASATGKINRNDWGISYGKGMVGDEVTIEIDVEALPKK